MIEKGKGRGNEECTLSRKEKVEGKSQIKYKEQEANKKTNRNWKRKNEDKKGSQRNNKKTKRKKTKKNENKQTI